MKFRVMIERDEDGNFIAQCPSLPGCTSEGKKREEALVNIKDAIEGYLASLRKHNEPIPPSIEHETIEVRKPRSNWFGAFPQLKTFSREEELDTHA